MHRVLRVGIAAIVSISAVVGIVGTTSSVGAYVDGESFSGEDVDVTLRWRPCFGEFGPGFECATARVPLDYDRLDGGKIPVDLVRLPASGDPELREGSLFLNPGGPGGSGIDFILGAGPFLFTDEVRATYDLVGFDPRGIIRSNPLLCFGTLNAAFSAFAPFAFPTTPDEEDILRGANNFLQTQCDNRGGIIQNKMSSANVARDLEVLRAAVGDEQLNFAGYSYGSVLGQVYAGLFPDNVGHVIIDGVIDIQDWVGDPGVLARDTTVLNQRIRSDIGAEDSLEEFFRQCDAAGPPDCLIAPDAEVRGRAVLDDLQQNGPVFVTDPFSGETFPVSYEFFVGNVLGALYATDAWGFIGFIFADVEAALAAAGRTASPVLGTRLEQLETMVPVRRPNPKYPNFVEGFPGVTCSDTSNPVNFDAWSDAAAQLSVESPTFGSIWTWSDSVCNRWPGKDQDRFVGPFGRDTANPVLVLSTVYDPATSYQQAQSARDRLPGSVLVTVDGAGHTTLFTSTCVDQIQADFLIRDIVPADNTVCAQDINLPFAPIEPQAQEGRQALLRQVGRPG